LNKFCKNDYLKAKLNEITLNVNKIIFEAYLVANLHVIKLLGENKPIPPLNTKFFQNVLQLSSKLYKRKAKLCNDIQLQETFNSYEQSRPNGYKVAYRDYITSILNYVALEMETSTKNHLILNFYRRFTHYIKHKHPEMSKKEIYEVTKGLFNKNSTMTHPILHHYRAILNNVPINEVAVEKNPTSILKIYNEILTYNKANELRLFSLLPTKQSFHMSYITLDTNGLRDLLLEENLLPVSKADIRHLVKENIALVRSKFFNIQCYETEKKKFHSFKTDGVSAAILLEVEGETKKRLPKKRKRDPEPSVVLSNYDVAVGVDPGLRYLFVAKNDGNIEGKKGSVRMSSKQYYNDCKFNWKACKQQ
jgi:hypothetical protein